jgi:Tfp pilus assembly protein PilF
VFRWVIAGILVVAAAGSFAQDAEVLKSRKVCRQLLRQVLDHFEADRPDSAAHYAALAMDCDPSQPDSYWYLAHAQLILGDPVEARRVISLGVDRAPLSQRLALQKARFCLEDGALEEAGALVDRVLIIPRNRGEALYLKGQIQLARGDSLAALQSWHDALMEEFPESGRR